MAKVLVIGAAKSGIAVSKLLNKHGYDVYLTDQKEIKEKDELQQMGINVDDLGHPDYLKTLDYEMIVKNPGIPYHVPFVRYFDEKGIKIVTEIEIAYRYAKRFKYGAISGTNGKTTITTLLYEMMKQSHDAYAAGNIGLPLSCVALEKEMDELLIALELSNFQLLGIDTFKPHVSVVCNLAPDHLDYMGSVEAYYASKMRIYENCDACDYFIRNCDDALVMQYAKDIPCQVIDFSLKEKKDLYVENGYAYLHDVCLFKVEDLKLVGDYNLANAMMASAMAYLLDISLDDIQHVIKSFKGVEHRLEYVDSVNKVRFYNDSKATNPHATSACLSSFKKPIILLAGGYDKKIAFDDLKQYDDVIACCIAFGQTKEQFKDIFTNVVLKDNMEDAFNYALQIASEGMDVVLSPACASYDQFNSYEQRGEIFKSYVEKYKGDIK